VWRTYRLKYHIRFLDSFSIYFIPIGCKTILDEPIPGSGRINLFTVKGKIKNIYITRVDKFCFKIQPFKGFKIFETQCNNALETVIETAGPYCKGLENVNNKISSRGSVHLIAVTNFSINSDKLYLKILFDWAYCIIEI